MKHENKRHKTVGRSKERIFCRTIRSAKRTRGASSKFGQYRNQQRAQDSNGYVSLFSESFIRSLNKTIGKIEGLEITPFTVDDRNKEYLDLCSLLNAIDLPEFEDIDIDPLRYRLDIERKLSELVGIEIVIGEDEPNIFPKCLPNETFGEGFFFYQYDDMDTAFKKGYGLIYMIILIYLKKQRQFSEFGMRGAEMYAEWEAENECDDIEDQKESFHLARKIVMADKRMDMLFEYYLTDINLPVLADTIRSFAAVYDSKDLLILAQGFEGMALFTKEWDQKCALFCNESNIFDIFTWCGNEDQFEFVDSYLNEVYGDQGNYVTYSTASDYTYAKLDSDMFKLWKTLKSNPVPGNMCERYYNILKIFHDGEFIKEFTRVSGESNLIAALYGKLDEMSGGSTCQCKKWESIGNAASFASVLKEAYRFSTRE